MRKNMMKELFRHERIRTTKAKAQMVRGPAERMITLAKKGNAAGEAKAVHARRQAAAKLADPILKLGPREGDGAEMVLLELVEE
jgi:large subunit ribosomal protein L17